MRFSPAEREGARDSLRSFLEAAISPADLRIAPGEPSACAARIWRGLGELGWLGLTVDAAFGGLGLDFCDLEILYGELGRQAAPAVPVGTLVVAEAISMAGDAALKSTWLPRIVAGEVRVAMPACFGEECTDAGDALFGDAASNIAATVQVSGKRRGLALREIVGERAGAPALDRTRRLFEAQQGEPSDTIWLEADQWAILVDHMALALASDCVGGSAFILNATVEYLCVRTQFGRVIGSFQALKHRAADWKVLQEACHALTGAAFAAHGADAPDASGVKAYVCDAYAAIAGDAVQLHGGIGFTWEHACHIYLKRAKLNQALLGGSITHLDRAARRAFGGGAHV